ncbi:MAG: hypothetical protein COV74_00545 [Candidatus Omnitrophica bacterium CG11_big_fil_rev_8_21_14_0_20_45_26]|uniref:PilZ domain-containing protein n=1 Tax=Candidatus Abzuiibacterium crystallinum TaxID=1974748 RepID=A0A2H0LSV3_9BACT|nr:MAG: hypothetical protein COV74_00545 [Candidatus Omnitrophica bacterium CG11_big_fil_rev_8_21_14_0_20_45_26]PIW63377.1 MAG: hypothetical protein COW12_10625 [Candidatus Omnitrophica bacterium CG12_big_fil_rev_8_21_14_0_65_45_16]
MKERRDTARYEVEIPIVLATIGLRPNIDTPACIVNLSRIGAKIVSPLYFESDQPIHVRVEMIGGPFKLSAHLLRCTQDDNQKVRYEKTYVLHVSFQEKLNDQNWQTLLDLGKC